MDELSYFIQEIESTTEMGSFLVDKFEKFLLGSPPNHSATKSGIIETFATCKIDRSWKTELSMIIENSWLANGEHSVGFFSEP